jgi:PrtD family type I secretion system ABC transporter
MTLWPFRRIFLVVGVFSLFINLLMLVTPLYMLQIYDRVLTSQSKDTLLVLTLLAVALLAIGAILELTRSRIMVRLGAQLDRQLAPALFSAQIRDRLAGQGGGEPIRDLETLRGFLTGPALAALFDAPWTPVFITIIFLFHPWLGAVALAGGALLFLLALVSEAATRGPLRSAGADGMEAHRFAQTSLRNADAVWAMGMLHDLRRNWEQMHLSALGLAGSASDWIGAFSALARFIRMVLQVALLGLGAYLVIGEQISAGVMIAASIIMSRALSPVESSIAHWRSFINARAAYARVTTLLGRRQAADTHMRLPAPSGALSVEGATLMAPGASKATLINIGFELKPGEMLGIIGPSAAGKSSLARMLMGIWTPMAGEVRLDGADIADWARSDVGKYVGYLPQNIELFDGTVAQNIARFQEGAHEAVIQAARLANVHEMILRLPDGYETSIGESGTALSGGQRQRVGLARAIYKAPMLIVLDEPNANLDGEGEAALSLALKRLKALKRTVIVISHKRSILACADKLLVLDGGRIRKFGPRVEVLQELKGSGGAIPLQREPQDLKAVK